MAGNEAKFTIELDGNAEASAAAIGEKLDKLRQQAQGSTEKVRAMSKELGKLTGKSDEVVAAKSKLKAKLESEKEAIYQTNAEIGKQVKGLASLKKEQEAAAKGTDRFHGAMSTVGGPLGEATEKFQAFNKNLDGATGFQKVALGATIAIAAVVGFGAAILGATIAVAKWIITTADIGRNAALMREAFAGSAENGARLGTQVDALAKKVPIAKDKLNEMATQLMRTRLSGQAIVDTMNVVGQAGAAMGDDVGGALKNIITRGQMAQRIQINPQELVGTGLQFKAIASALAKNLNIGIKEAEQRLYTGRVKLDQGAKAIRDAVEDRFGAVNAKKLISLGSITQSLHDRFVKLTSGVNLERILGPISDMAKFFDDSTIQGKVLGDIITSLGQLLGTAFTGAVPKIGAVFDQLENWFLKSAIWALQNKQAIVGMWDDGIRLGGTFVDVLKTAAKILGWIGEQAVASGEKLGWALDKLGVIDGKGAQALTPEQFDAKHKGTGGAVGTAQAHADGGLVMKPAPGEAFASVAAGEHIVPAGASIGGRGGSADIKISFNIQAGGGDPAQITKELSGPAFLTQLTQAIEDAARAAGIPTQSQVAP